MGWILRKAMTLGNRRGLGGTWDSTKKPAAYSLSAGDLIVTQTGGSGYRAIGGTSALTKDARWSVTVNARGGGNDVMIGAAAASLNWNGVILGTGPSIAYRQIGEIVVGGSTVASEPAILAGHTIGVEYKASTQSIRFQRNDGVFTSWFYVGSFGALYAAAGLYYSGDKVTLNPQG